MMWFLSHKRTNEWRERSRRRRRAARMRTQYHIKSGRNPAPVQIALHAPCILVEYMHISLGVYACHIRSICPFARGVPFGLRAACRAQLRQPLPVLDVPLPQRVDAKSGLAPAGGPRAGMSQSEH